MPPQRRRDIFLRDHNGVEVGGLRQHGSVTHSDVYAMVEIISILNEDFRLYRWNGLPWEEVAPDDREAAAGDYTILRPDRSPVEVVLTDETTLNRLLSAASTPRTSKFRDDIRARDGGCVVTSIRAEDEEWDGFAASHIFPRAWENVWQQQNYRRWVTSDPPHLDPPGRRSIDSPRNGLVLQDNVHRLFDTWGFSINPDNGYKITTFRSDAFGLDGRILHQSCRNPDDPRRVSDELLRWHFRQAVLFNVKGAGEPLWEWDFPPGTDMIGEIMREPGGPRRMEIELATRLGQPIP